MTNYNKSNKSFCYQGHHGWQGSQGLVLCWVSRNRKQRRQWKCAGEVANTMGPCLPKMYHGGPDYRVFFFCLKIGLVFNKISANSRFLVSGLVVGSSERKKKAWRILVRNVDFFAFPPTFFFLFDLRYVFDLFDLFSQIFIRAFYN